MPGPYPADRTLLGVAKEVTKGLPVVPLDLIPVTSLTTFRNIRQLEDKGWRSSMGDIYNQVQGPWSTEIDFGGEVFPDLQGYWYKSILGDETVTGAGAPYSHAFALNNATDGQPPTFTFTDFYGPTSRQFPYGILASYALKYQADGFISYTAKAHGRADSTVATPAVSYTLIPPMAAWITTLTLFGTTLQVVSGDVTFTRTAAPLFTMGSQDAYAIWGGTVQVHGKLTCLLLDDTLITGYYANTQGILVLNSIQGAGATLVQHQITASKAAIKVSKPARHAEAMRVEVDFIALLNLTDAGASGGQSPAKVILQSAKALQY